MKLSNKQLSIIDKATGLQQKELEALLLKIEKIVESTTIKVGDKEYLFPGSLGFTWISASSTDEVNQVLNQLPMDSGPLVYDRERTSDLNYYISIENPCKPSNSFPYCVVIGYNCNGVGVKIKCPIVMAGELVRKTSRKITDSEYHYFIGETYNQLMNKTVLSFDFGFTKTEDRVINWYGGDKTSFGSRLNKLFFDRLTGITKQLIENQ